MSDTCQASDSEPYEFTAIDLIEVEDIENYLQSILESLFFENTSPLSLDLKRHRP